MATEGRPMRTSAAPAWRVAALLLMPLAVLAHGTQPHRADLPREQQPFGIAGEPSRVGRTVQIDMGDDMRFKPDRIRVREGETLRLRIRNRGRLMHELVIGSAQSLAEHAELMRRFPNMEHAEAHMAHVAPGREAELLWHFNRAGSFEFACLIDGHFQAGMRGTLIVEPSKQEKQDGKN